MLKKKGKEKGKEKIRWAARYFLVDARTTCGLAWRYMIWTIDMLTCHSSSHQESSLGLCLGNEKPTKDLSHLIKSWLRRYLSMGMLSHHFINKILRIATKILSLFSLFMEAKKKKKKEGERSSPPSYTIFQEFHQLNPLTPMPVF